MRYYILILLLFSLLFSLILWRMSIYYNQRIQQLTERVEQLTSLKKIDYSDLAKNFNELSDWFNNIKEFYQREAVMEGSFIWGQVTEANIMTREYRKISETFRKISLFYKRMRE